MNFAYTLRSAGGFLLLFLALFLTDTSAPLLAQGNIEWQEVWVNRQLRGNFPNHPNAWMNHGRSYTGLAYDRWNDVVYIVNPKDCNVGGFFFRCPEIHAWHADSGTVAHHIGNPANGTGKLFVDTQIIDSSFSQGQYEIFKIDLDDEGRIFVCNVVAPIWGICYPGPPPDCDPDYLSQGPFRIYRYDSHDADPKQVYRTQVYNPALGPLDPLATSPTGINSEMNWTMWGTSFDVVGKRHVIHSPTGDDIVDSVRIFASGGKFYSGAVSVNDQINVFVSDTRTLAPMEYRLGLYLQHNEPQSGIAAHGIAATGPFMESQIWMDSNFRETVLNNQGQNPAQPLPQTVSMSLNQSIDLSTTGPSGPIKYYYNETFQRPFLIVADGMNSSTQITDPNYNTTARVIDLGASPDPEMWPPQATPQFSNERLVNLTGIDNFISDVDYKVWVDPTTGLPHLQVFVLMTGNGIACYRTKKPLPVELQMFQGFVNDSRIDLVWQVTSEVNNHGFEIHRSFDGGTHWDKIGFVEGRGTSYSQKEYHFSDPLTDVHTSIGMVKYRLRQVDYNGDYKWSPTVDVYINTSPQSIALHQNYPNPFRERTSISYQLQQPGFVTLTLYDALGKKVETLVNEYKSSGVHQVAFGTGDLPAGTYLYQLNANGTVEQRKLSILK